MRALVCVAAVTVVIWVLGKMPTMSVPPLWESYSGLH